jgi:hypothetical protein
LGKTSPGKGDLFSGTLRVPLLPGSKIQVLIRFLSEYSIFHDAEKDPTRFFASGKTEDLY